MTKAGFRLGSSASSRVGQRSVRAANRTRIPEWRHAIDLGEEIELVEFSDDGRFALAFMAQEVVKAVAIVEPLAGPNS
jgi:hypothetical protein